MFFFSSIRNNKVLLATFYTHLSWIDFILNIWTRNTMVTYRSFSLLSDLFIIHKIRIYSFLLFYKHISNSLNIYKSLLYKVVSPFPLFKI